MVGMLSMFWLFPLMLASTAFAPAESMPGWLQPFATYQPMSVASDAVRGLCDGTLVAGDLALAGGWTVVLLVVFGPLSMRMYQRTGVNPVASTAGAHRRRRVDPRRRTTG